MLSENGYKNIIFVADSALISTESLKNFVLSDLQFISRFPETFNLAEELKLEAWEQTVWETIGILAKEPKGAAFYMAWRTEREIEGDVFGFTVVFSSKLAKRKEKTLENNVKNSETTLKRHSKELVKIEYACEADAMKEGQRLQKNADKKGFSNELEIEKREKKRYSHKGRPKNGEIPTIKTTWHAKVTIGSMRDEVYEQKKNLSSTFVLIHRLKEEKTSEEILRNYKNQDKVEQGFKFIKQPYYLGPVYTKITSRVKSLGYIFLIVLLLAKYLEYRVRFSMQQSGGELKIGGQKVKNPSAKTIIEILNKMMIYAVNGEIRLPDYINQKILDVIHWAGFNEDVYIRGYTGDCFIGLKEG
jgi:transposase